jgi:TRAP-type C4-dicarboxylate transport system permease small subunit
MWKLPSKIVTAIALYFFPLFLFAAEVIMDRPGGGFQNPLKFDSISGFLQALLDALIVIAFPILVLFLVYAGFLFVSAQGNEQKLSDAKRIFLWTIIGALIVLGASALSRAIQGTVNSLRGDAPHERSLAELR